MQVARWARCYEADSVLWDPRGYSQNDAGELVKGNVIHKLSQNQVVTVLYDPDKPKKFAVYPVAGFDVGGPEGS